MTLLWTRHTRPPNIARFDETQRPVDGGSPGFGVGVARYSGPPVDLQQGVRLFAFL